MANGNGPDRDSKAYSEFLSEAEEMLERLRGDLADLEDQRHDGGEVNPDLINGMFRSAHSLKGLSGMFGLDAIAGLAHHFEDTLDGLRLGRIALDSPQAGMIGNIIDLFGTVMASLGNEAEEDQMNASINELIANLEAGGTGTEEEDSQSVPRLLLDPTLMRALTEYEEHRLNENLRRHRIVLLVEAAFEILSFDEGLSELSSSIREVGEVISTLPSPGAAADSQIRFVLLVASDLDAPAMTRHIDSPNASVTAVPEDTGAASTETPAPAEKLEPPKAEPICAPPVHQQELSSLLVQADAPAPPPSSSVHYEESTSSAVDEEDAPHESPPPPGDGGRVPEEFSSLKSVSDTVRVDIRKLNELMNLVGELVMHRSAIGATVRTLSADAATARAGEDLGKTYKGLSRKLKDLQSSVLELRLVPLRQILDKLSRVVRRLRRELEKDVILELNGVDTELDKLMVEELVDPLVHLVRNSFDHGIEAADERVAAGKSEQGRIVIDAFQRGNHVVIQVTDDGRGIDPLAVRAKAEKMGVIVSGMELTRKEILDLVFHPGLSTRAEVTGTSGRGVGMDVVRENIKEMGGIVTIDSDLGKGTVTSLTLPVTLAIIQSLIVGSSDQFYAIPLNAVLETLLIDANEIQSSEQQELLNLRGEPLTLRSLSDEFGLPRAEDAEQVYVVVIGIGESRLGLIVDRLEGQQDTVLKPIQGPIGEVRGISGATEISEHGAVLVLDVAAIVEDTLRRRDLR